MVTKVIWLAFVIQWACWMIGHVSPLSDDESTWWFLLQHHRSALIRGDRNTRSTSTLLHGNVMCTQHTTHCCLHQSMHLFFSSLDLTFFWLYLELYKYPGLEGKSTGTMKAFDIFVPRAQGELRIQCSITNGATPWCKSLRPHKTHSLLHEWNTEEVIKKPPWSKITALISGQGSHGYHGHYDSTSYNWSIRGDAVQTYRGLAHVGAAISQTKSRESKTGRCQILCK